MSLFDKNLSSRFKKATAQNQPEQEDKELDLDAFYQLRAKMLGVLIRDARLNASRTEAECARIMSVDESTYHAWEFGEAVPSVPQLEVLAFYLGVPVSHFWSNTTLREEYNDKDQAETEYIRLRTRMIGVLLRQAREDAGMSVEELAQDAGLTAERVQEYEMGDAAVPMHELIVMARSVDKTMSYFMETSGTIGELLAIREEWKHFAELPDDVRAFAANPINIGFIEIAIMLSKMPTEKLRSVGRSIVDITM